MARSYEDLSGGQGRQINFRAKRHLTEELLQGRHAAKMMTVDGKQYSLHDLAMNGVSCFSTDEKQWNEGSTVDATILVHEAPVYRGPLRVARIEHTSPKRVKVGLQLLKGFLDLYDIQHRGEEEELHRDLESDPEQVRQSVPGAYREIIDRMAHMFQYYRCALAEHEQRYAKQAGNGPQAIDALARRALRVIRKPWNELRIEAAKAIQPYLNDGPAMQAAKRYTETMITAPFVQSPMVYRCYLKPLGYPGDFESMVYIYANELEGPTILDRIIHKLICEEPLASGVRTRKDLVKELQEQEVDRALGPNRTFRVTSLACGPAREVVEFVAEHRNWPGHIHWTLIDQEERALSLAYHDVYRELSSYGTPGTVRCMYMSFQQLMEDPDSVMAEEPQDFIYASGLFDYLGEKRAQGLIKVMYDKLAPGGLLAIGNALGPSLNWWVPEFMLDWTLIYRTKEDMVNLACLVTDAESIEVVKESSNAYYFVLVRKKA